MQPLPTPLAPPALLVYPASSIRLPILALNPPFPSLVSDELDESFLTIDPTDSKNETLLLSVRILLWHVTWHVRTRVGS